MWAPARHLRWKSFIEFVTAQFQSNPEILISAFTVLLAFFLIENENALGLEKEKSNSSFLVELSQIEMPEIPTMEIVVLLRPSVARAFQDKSADRELADPAEIQAILDRFSAEMRPQHPGVTDPKLGSYFTIHGVSSQQVDEFLAALRHLDAVEAAYAKPFASPP